MNTATMLECGHPPTPDAGCGTGYAQMGSDGPRMCYACADAAQLAEITNAQPGARFTGYLSIDGTRWTTWTGGQLGTVVHSGKMHPWSRERYYVTVRDVAGHLWSGTGSPGMWATLKRGTR